MRKPSAPNRHRHSTTRHRQAHDKIRCLRIFRQLSAYIDDELPASLCQEIRRHLGACPNCETFMTSLRHIVWLCRHSPTPTLSTAEQTSMREKILKTAYS